MPDKKIQIRAGHRLTHLASLPQAAAGPAGVQIGDLWIPNLEDFPTALEKAHHLLSLAAGIEHALLIQYLYGAYSINAGADANLLAAKASVIQVAIEEMAHLLSVQNLLLLVKGEPTFKRTDRQQSELDSDRVVPFELKLEPFSKSSIAKYVVAEGPSDAAQVEPNVFPVIEAIAGQAHMGMIKQVGVLYLLLGVVVGDQDTLAQRAADGDDWSANVKDLADAIIAADEGNAADKPNFGGRDGMHLKDSDFATPGDEFLSRQARHADWDRSPQHTDDGDDPFILEMPQDRNSALDLLREISLQGEAAGTLDVADSHFRKFLQAFRDIYGDDGQNPEPAGIAQVPSAAVIEVDTNSAESSAISHPTTSKWARLADLRYAILLCALEQYMKSPPDDRQFLEAWAFVEMFHLKKLGEFLVEFPRANNMANGVAAVPFNLPERFVADGTISGVNVGGNTLWPAEVEQWFQEAIQIEAELLGLVSADQFEQTQFLSYMREFDQRKLAEATARKNGMTVRTTFDEVREILDWAIGTGDPKGPAHFGRVREGADQQGLGRFWGLSIEDLRTATVHGQEVIGTSSDDSGLLAVLGFRGEATMPGGGRPKLNNPEHSDKLQRIANWIDSDTPDDQRAFNPRHIETIHELRILPTLAIGRLGSSPEPMQNYNLEIEPDKEYRQIKSAETLVVSEVDGSIVGSTTPTNVRFKDAAGRVKPVAPFLELWGVFEEDGPLRPVTTAVLQQLGLAPEDIKWTVKVGNLKVFRRTGQTRDRITTAVENISDHESHDLVATAQNFKTSRSISLGTVRYIRPTPEFNEIRFRFTPAAGLVFGPNQDANIPAGQDVYNASAGLWDTHRDQIDPANPTPRSRIATAPGGIFARSRQGANLGYLDDSCDGLVTVSLTVDGTELTASARIASGPPDYAPDSYPVRTVADEFEQIVFGPEVTDVTADEVIDIMRRAFETVRAVSVSHQNDTFPFWQSAAQQIFGNNLSYVDTITVHREILDALQGLHEPATSPERQAAHAVLMRIENAARAYDQVNNYSNPGTTQDPGTRQMPALMRGADGELLALSRRQRAKLVLAVEKFKPEQGADTPRDAMVRMIQALQIFAALHGNIDVGGGETLQTIFGDPDQVLTFIQNGVVQGTRPEAVALAGQPLIVAGQADNSNLVTLIETVGHPMNSQLLGHTDPVSNKDGIQVVKDWINSL